MQMMQAEMQNNWPIWISALDPMAQEAASDFTIDFMFVVEYLIRRNEISNE